jgi:prefoldin alpha subunit
MTDETTFEEKYRELQQLQQQIEQIAEYVERLQGQQQELDNSIEALTELQKTTVNTEILATLANGIFLKAALKDNQKLVVNVGAGVTVEKNIPDILRLLEEQKEKIAENISEAETILQQMHEQGKRLYQESGEAAE